MKCLKRLGKARVAGYVVNQAQLEERSGYKVGAR